MKILKPGKVEQRKFVCPKCGCEFVVDKNETTRCVRRNTATGRAAAYAYFAKCPCREEISWDRGEHYEEPVQSDRDRLVTVLYKNWAMDDEFADSVAQTLIANGVTFREERHGTIDEQAGG